MKQNPDGFLLNAGCHGREHLITAELILYQRITLGKCLQANTLAQLFHIVDVIHPFAVNDLQKEYTL